MSQQWNPLQDLMLLQDRMNQLFEDATQRRARNDANTRDDFERADWTPPADVYETEAGYVIAIDLPGIDRKAVEIDLDDNRLVVKGTRVIEESMKQRTERPGGKFLRTFTIPSSVNQSQIGAEYRDGVLQIRLPKRNEQKSKRVEIKVS
jgi:HSP20 family protein